MVHSTSLRLLRRNSYVGKCVQINYWKHTGSIHHVPLVSSICSCVQCLILEYLCPCHLWGLTAWRKLWGYPKLRTDCIHKWSNRWWYGVICVWKVYLWHNLCCIHGAFIPELSRWYHDRWILCPHRTRWWKRSR